MTLSRYSLDLIDNLYARAVESAYLMTNLVTLRLGVGHKVVIHSFTPPDQNEQPIIFEDASLRLISETENPSFDMAMFNAVFSEHTELTFALADLTSLLTDPFLTFINAARIIDTLRKAITPVPLSGETRSERIASWEAMRNALGFSEHYLSYISLSSTDARHGKRNVHTDYDEQEVRSRAWTAMCRFLEYNAQGKVPLPSLGFAILNGE